MNKKSLSLGKNIINKITKLKNKNKRDAIIFFKKEIDISPVSFLKIIILLKIIKKNSIKIYEGENINVK